MRFDYKLARLARNRDDVIVELCRSRRVLHVGAADSPYTREKFADGLLLHERLSGVASELVGIDLDGDSAAWLKQQGLPEIRVLDINDVTDIGFKPDVVIFGETIEHVVNIGNCLANLKACMGRDTRLVISTPNCLHLWFTSMVLRDYEVIHDDHKVGFTYGLLHQLLASQNLAIEDFYFTFLPRSKYPLWRRAWYRICTLRRGFAETLLVVCRTG